MEKQSPDNNETKPEENRAGSRIRVWTSSEMLGNMTEAKIKHGDDIYRLLLTKNQKLILVK